MNFMFFMVESRYILAGCSNPEGLFTLPVSLSPVNRSVAFDTLLSLLDKRVDLAVSKQGRRASRVQQDHDVILGVVAGTDAIN